MRESWRANSILFLFLLFFAGQVYSSAIQSISIVLMILIAFVDFGKTDGLFYFKYSKFHAKQFLSVWKHPSYWIFILFFTYLLIPYSSCQDWEYLSQRWVIKLPFLLLPAAFLTYDKPLGNKLSSLFLIFLVILTGQHMFTYFQQVNSHTDYTFTLKIGQSIATPGSHIKYSVITALVTMTNLYFLLFKYQTKSRSIITSLLIVFNIIFLHYLSVRTGLLVLYLSFLSLFISYIVSRKRKTLGISLAIGIILTPIFFYSISEGFRTKVNYMIYDLEQYSEGKGEDYSDSGRLTSITVGLEIFKEHPIIGVGGCNMRPIVAKKFNDLYPKYTKSLLPHNQFLFTAVNAGVIGLICLLIGFIFPFYQSRFKTPYTIAIFVSFIILFIFDQFLEGTVGVGIYLFYSLITLKFLAIE